MARSGLSFGVRRAWGCTDLPWAHDVTPEAYRSLGFRSNWGGVVEVLGGERDALRCPRRFMRSIFPIERSCSVYQTSVIAFAKSVMIARSTLLLLEWKL